MALTPPVKEEVLHQEESIGLVATDVTVIAATVQETISSMICSGLETVNGNFTDRYDSALNLDDKCSSKVSTKISSVISYPTPCVSQVANSPCVSGTLKMVGSSLSSETHCVFKSNSNNNSNIDGGYKMESQSSEDVRNPPRKKPRTSTACHKGNIEVSLEGKQLWDEFCRRGTEMIVNRAGRRMFPGFSVAICLLKPKTKYTMKLEVVLADNHRFKFLNSRWLAVGSAEPQPLSESYLHPDSPNSGAFWMRHGISFRKLKITNNKEKPGNNALLYSMHKYFLRLIVEEERKILSVDDKLSSKVVFQADFPETTFVAVTAYQNEEVTQLKITNNPFAKAFRENATDMDWETAQMLYSNQNTFSPLQHQQTDHHLGAHVITSGNWTFPSPLLSPTPFTPSLPPPLSPLSGFIASNNACSGYLTPGQFPYNSSSALTNPHYFQWPTPHAHHSTHLSQVTSPNPYQQLYHKMEHYPSSTISCTTAASLPDFETVYTTLPN